MERLVAVLMASLRSVIYSDLRNSCHGLVEVLKICFLLYDLLVVEVEAAVSTIQESRSAAWVLAKMVMKVVLVLTLVVVTVRPM
jgi:hypothetical protein